MSYPILHLAQDYNVSEVAGTVAGICLLVALIAWLAKKFKGDRK